MVKEKRDLLLLSLQEIAHFISITSKELWNVLDTLARAIETHTAVGVLPMVMHEADLPNQLVLLTFSVMAPHSQQAAFQYTHPHLPPPHLRLSRVYANKMCYYNSLS